MNEHGYAQHLRAVVSATAAPHGYTLALWTGGGITIHAEGAPSTVDALLLLGGAIAAYALLGASAFRGLGGVLVPAAAGGVRIWGALHFFSVGVSIVACSVLNHLVAGWPVWPLVGFTTTGAYLAVLSVQFWVAGTPAGPPVTTAPGAAATG